MELRGGIVLLTWMIRWRHGFRKQKPTAGRESIRLLDQILHVIRVLDNCKTFRAEIQLTIKFVKNQLTYKHFVTQMCESQLNYYGGRWSTPAAMHVQRFVSPVLPDQPF
ncbi:hypothetical protein TNCV_3499711 [Trichonephila clavipes]|nr:hypothetical protein TNCV_3499711 [Trichonephila clavipes]